MKLTDFIGCTEISLDTETTGLEQSDRVFLVSMTTERGSVCEDLRGQSLEYKKEFWRQLTLLASDPNITWYMANAAYDLWMLKKEGVIFKGPVIDPLIACKLINNMLAEYSLDSLSFRELSKIKSTAVEDYITRHGLITKVRSNYRARQKERKHFDKVPAQVIVPYAIRDSELTFELSRKVLLKSSYSGDSPRKSLLLQEGELSKVCAAVRDRGICVDRAYVHSAIHHEKEEQTRLREEFSKITGESFVNKKEQMRRLFGDQVTKFTPTGELSFDEESMQSLEHPAAKVILKIRAIDKRISTYWGAFLESSQFDGRVHASMNQAGPRTGRFSYSDPNLQNVPKEDEPEDLQKDFLVRESFVPSPGHFFASLDYVQQEYAVMADLSGELKLIEAYNSGADVHQATADILNITRKQAKAINFGLLYGQMDEALAKSLGISVPEAREFRRMYFSKLPRVKRYIEKVTQAGRQRGFIENIYGRRLCINNASDAYVLPNHEVQSTCADLMKKAMVKIYQSELVCPIVLQVHDELLLDVPLNEPEVVDRACIIMQNVYTPQNGIKLRVSDEYSTIAWGKRQAVSERPCRVELRSEREKLQAVAQLGGHVLA